MSDCQPLQCCPDNPFNTIPTESATVYWNTKQCVTLSCPDNPSITETACIDAGMFASYTSQADADAQALAAATQEATNSLSCSFTATEQVCLDCPTGSAEATIIPVMTSDTTPSGVCSADIEIISQAYYAFDSSYLSWFANATLPSYLQYQFPSQRVVSKYALTILPGSHFYPKFGDTPKSWTFEASNDGSNWTVLDTRTNYYGFNQNSTTRVVFTISNITPYSYYRWVFTARTEQSQVERPIDSFSVVLAELISTGIIQVCASETRSSLVSLEDAVNLAYSAALNSACASCFASGGAGTASIIPITMPDTGWGLSSYVAADEYPSVINIPTSGLITKVKVTINALAASTDGNQWIFLLRGPDGTTVLLWSDAVNSGTPSSWTAPLTLTFDDDAVAVTPVSLVSGTYKPSNGGVQPTYNPDQPAPQMPYSLALSAFIGKQAQGGWSLWCASRLRQQVKVSGGWSLNITTT